MATYSIRLSESRGATTEQAIQDFESIIGTRLPDDYRLFLLRTNGGRAEEAGFRLRNKHGAYSDSLVDWFYGLHSDHYNRLDKSFRLSRDVVPREYVPIGRDPFGNPIYIGIHGGARGRVFFFNQEGATDEDPELNRGKIFLVADSFDEFLALLGKAV